MFGRNLFVGNAELRFLGLIEPPTETRFGLVYDAIEADIGVHPRVPNRVDADPLAGARPIACIALRTPVADKIGTTVGTVAVSDRMRSVCGWGLRVRFDR